MDSLPTPPAPAYTTSPHSTRSELGNNPRTSSSNSNHHSSNERETDTPPLYTETALFPYHQTNPKAPPDYIPDANELENQSPQPSNRSLASHVPTGRTRSQPPRRRLRYLQPSITFTAISQLGVGYRGRSSGGSRARIRTYNALAWTIYVTLWALYVGVILAWLGWVVYRIVENASS